MTALDDRALIALAFQKGREFCEENISRWWRNDWGLGEDARQAQQDHWRANAQRMAELFNEMRKKP